MKRIEHREMILYLMLWITIVVGQGISYRDFHEKELPRSLSLKEPQQQNLLQPFNRTRIPGSRESRHIQEFLKHFFLSELHNKWLLEIDSFEQNGYNFTNLVFTQRLAERYIVLAAHYDTKIEPQGFLGAMDSAASCAILLYLARYIDHIYAVENVLMNRLLLEQDLAIKIIFFDGEEALEEWGPEDSIYGSKHLANKWKTHDILSKVELFVLMDLIGSNEHNPINSYYAESHSYYGILSDIEKAYMALTGLTGSSSITLDSTEHRFLKLRRSVIGDDHLPFYDNGIPILHLIPFPFPSTWHTIYDDFEHLDQEEIYKWAIMMSEFVLRVPQAFNSYT